MEFYQIAIVSHSLQFERGPEHDGSAAERVGVGVGVDAVEEGVGVVALVQEVVELEAEHEALALILGGGVEERHTLVLVGGELAAHVVIVEREVEVGDGEDMDGAAMGEGGCGVAFFGITGARPAVIDVVPQFEPGDGGDGGVAVQGIAVRAGAHNGLVHGLFVAAETVAAVGSQLGEERGDVLRGGYGELVERLRLSRNRAVLLTSMPLTLCDVSVFCLPSLWLAARLNVKYCMGSCHFHSPDVRQVLLLPMMPDEVRTER